MSESATMNNTQEAAEDVAAEQKYFEETYEACRDYMTYHLSANHLRRMNFLTLPKDQRDLLINVGFKDKLDAVDEGIRRNAEFLEEIARTSSLPFLPDQEQQFLEATILEDDGPTYPAQQSHAITNSAGHSHSHDHGHSHSHDHQSPANLKRRSDKQVVAQRQAARDQAQEKIRSTLRQMVRDWTIEGQGERNACYQACIDALEQHFANIPRDRRSSLKVLVPGAGLGRLPLELAARGFAAQGNEFSAHMLIASNWCLNESSSDEPHQIFPYLHSFSNHLTTSSSVLKHVSVPDVSPASLLSPGADFSFVAGDFLEVYGGMSHDGSSERPTVPPDHAGQWDSIVSVFFIDTARNIVNYLQTIWGLLNEGGVWVNLGPLLWHFENVPDKERGEGSIDLSLDEVKGLARHIGFEISDERIIRTTYAGHADSMLRSEYQAAFWTATKRTAKGST